ncbi:mid region of cactin-domain-containing protein [Aspergillus egyptiacus]|nr:mid region of cactin-domain-containing protein [Aspergillus egyptiacus]
MSSRYADRTRIKRSRSRSPHSDHSQKYPRRPDERDQRYDSARYRDQDMRPAPPHARGMRDQMRLNQLQEDERVREWVAQEDVFVLKQAKKKAEIRVKEGRAKPIDWLTVILRVIDPTRNPLDDEIADSELDLVDPDGVFEGLEQTELGDLEKDIDTFLGLESNPQNRDYWKTMKVICKDRRKTTAPEGRALSSVAADINKLLSPKSYEQLETLEGQVRKKLDSNEPIDTDYWEELLRSLTVWMARAKLKKVYQAVIEERVRGLRQQQREEAESVRSKLAPLAPTVRGDMAHAVKEEEFRDLDPDPLLQIRPEDKVYEVVDEEAFLDQVARERSKILKMGYVPLRQRHGEKASAPISSSTATAPVASNSTRFSSIPNEDFSQATKALYERELAKGVSENEEIFTGEESVSTGKQPQWANKYRPRKPRYFNRVQMGYEWNKYNQTHYDHDNPPPKVVQGYKFNIFYPDLIDKTKAPTYRIEREHGRKRGQSFAAAGEEDTCLIRFMAGPPYEDIAFRIVDKEWDYSAKRERGFKSTFDKGILQLHFQFKRVRSHHRSSIIIFLNELTAADILSQISLVYRLLRMLFKPCPSTPAA